MSVSYTKGDPMPKSLGACADELKVVQALRLAMKKETDAVQAREIEISEHILEELATGDDTGASGLKYRAQVKVSVAASVENWEDVYDYVAENDRFDLLGKSVQQKAIKAMWEEGATVPGVSKINVKKLSITKL